jgi:hypothetical protein
LIARAMTETTTACERCGNYGELTASWGRLLCDECSSRRVQDEARTLTVGRLVAQSLVLTRALGWRVLLAAACMGAVAEADDALCGLAGVRGFWGHAVFNPAAIALTTDLFDACVVLVCLSQLGGFGTSSSAWRGAALAVRRRFLPLVLLNWMLGVVGILSMVCLVLPLFFVCAWWTVAQPIVVLEARSPFRALGEAAKRIYPKLGTIVLATFVLLVVPVGLSLFAGLAFGSSWSNPSIGLKRTLLRALTHATSIPSTCFAAALYVKLVPGKLPAVS